MIVITTGLPKFRLVGDFVLLWLLLVLEPLPAPERNNNVLIVKQSWSVFGIVFVFVLQCCCWYQLGYCTFMLFLFIVLSFLHKKIINQVSKAMIIRSQSLVHLTGDCEVVSVMQCHNMTGAQVVLPPVLMPLDQPGSKADGRLQGENTR